jgi:uncharacterized membrane protein YqaE (UPF0057 family)
MKRSTLTLLASGLAVAAMLSSCSMMNNEFSKQRYTKFNNRHGSAVVEQTNKSSFVNTLTIAADHTSKVEMEVAPQSPVNGNVSVLNVPDTKIVTTTSTQSYQDGSGTIRQHSSLRPRQELREMRKADRHSKGDVDGGLLVLLCILLPPLAVYLVKGMGNAFIIDLILCLFFWLPGIIYAFIVCF